MLSVGVGRVSVVVLTVCLFGLGDARPLVLSQSDLPQSLPLPLALQLFTNGENATLLVGLSDDEGGVFGCLSVEQTKTNDKRHPSAITVMASEGDCHIDNRTSKWIKGASWGTRAGWYNSPYLFLFEEEEGLRVSLNSRGEPQSLSLQLPRKPSNVTLIEIDDDHPDFKRMRYNIDIILKYYILPFHKYKNISSPFEGLNSTHKDFLPSFFKRWNSLNESLIPSVSVKNGQWENPLNETVSSYQRMYENQKELSSVVIIPETMKEGQCLSLVSDKDDPSLSYYPNETLSVTSLSLQERDGVLLKMIPNSTLIKVDAYLSQDYEFCKGSFTSSGNYSLDEGSNGLVPLQLNYIQGHNATLTLNETFLLSIDATKANNTLCNDPWFRLNVLNAERTYLNCDPVSTNLTPPNPPKRSRWQRKEISVEEKLKLGIPIRSHRGIATLHEFLLHNMSPPAVPDIKESVHVRREDFGLFKKLNLNVWTVALVLTGRVIYLLYLREKDFCRMKKELKSFGLIYKDSTMITAKRLYKLLALCVFMVIEAVIVVAFLIDINLYTD